jgi:nucleotide-binding universal stress UspA family protein
MHTKPVAVDAGMAPVVMPEQATAEEIQADLAHLQKLTEPLRTNGVNVSLKQYHDVNIDGFVEDVPKLKTDVIVVGSHPHNAFFNLLVGSVTSDILKRAKCPVLAVSTE